MKKQFCLAAFFAAALCACGPDVPQLGKASVEEVVKAMTLEEKVHLVIGTGMAEASGDQPVIGRTDKSLPGAAGTSYPIERLGIPAVVFADGPAGLRIDATRPGDTATYYCTHFPIATLLASTWDVGMVKEVGRAIGNEALEYGADVLLGPGMNIQRNPLCGRNFEYFSEDPVLTGALATAYVRGVQKNGVGASVKHFAANNQETNRGTVDVHVSQRALREIYLRGFEWVVGSAEPWTVMSSYNYLNGTYTSENPELLTTLLRDEWDYEGMVVTDWFGGQDAVAQMTAGNDMLQPGLDKQYETLLAAVRDGKLDEKVLDRNVTRILQMILRTPRFKGYEYSNKPDLKAHAGVARRAAAEGMVLLENRDGALPLDSAVRSIALFGCTSYDFIAGGTGSGNVNRAYTVSLLDGLEGAGYAPDRELRDAYEAHLRAEKERIARLEHAPLMPEYRPVELSLPAERIRELAAKNDAALVTIGRTSGEFLDRRLSDFYLSKDERRLLEDVSAAFHAAGKRVVVVLNIGGVVETASWKQLPDAILCAWQPGQEGGNSVADVLSGRVSPSGRLPMTFPVRFEDVPSSANFPVDQTAQVDLVNKQEKKAAVRNVDYVDYEEDIYVGYRYFDSFGKEVSYPFGYGLSYSTFAVDSLQYWNYGSYFTISCRVTNTGTVPAKEVLQLYVSAPDAAARNKPDKELKSFYKTDLLQPGEAGTARFIVSAYSLASFDEGLSSWLVEGGDYNVQIASSVSDIKLTQMLEIPADTIKAHDILRPQQPLRLLRR